MRVLRTVVLTALLVPAAAHAAIPSPTNAITAENARPGTRLGWYGGTGGRQLACNPHPADAVRGVATRSGARMFAAGSIQFAWGLDGYGNHLPSRRLQLLMEKALSDMTRPAPPRPLTVDAATGRLRARRPAAAAIGGATGQARSATRRCPSTAGALRRRPSQPGADPTDHVWDSSSLGTSPITTV
jgi:hypothetical protein